MTAVLDASAALVLLKGEPGHDVVARFLPGSMISAVNYSEVVQKLTQLGSPSAEDDAAALISLGATVAPFDAWAAVDTARLWPLARTRGLSLGDRACLALASDIPDGVALTSDRAWATLDLDIPIRLIR